MATVNFSGIWKLTKKENFEEFSVAVGMPWIVRKMAANSYPTMEIVQDGDHFKITLTTMMATNVSEFTIGEEFVFEPPKSGQKFTAVCRWEGEKMFTEAASMNPEESSVLTQRTVRELNGQDEIIETITVTGKGREGEVTMKRYFTRVK